MLLGETQLQKQVSMRIRKQAPFPVLATKVEPEYLLQTGAIGKGMRGVRYGNVMCLVHEIIKVDLAHNLRLWCWRLLWRVLHYVRHMCPPTAADPACRFVEPASAYEVPRKML